MGKRVTKGLRGALLAVAMGAACAGGSGPGAAGEGRQGEMERTGRTGEASGRNAGAVPDCSCVPALRKLIQARAAWPIPKGLEDGLRPAGTFDPNLFFTVLTHVAAEPGYVLDYVYLGESLGARPVVYARAKAAAPFATYADLQASQGGAKPGPPFERYMAHVRPDGSPTGFFEWIVLGIAGEQFYLDWHAAYNDSEVVCGGTALDGILAEISSPKAGAALKAEDAAKARALDIAPKVALQGDRATVSLVTFTAWGGFERRSYAVSVQAPHRLLEEERDPLLAYDCGIRF